MSTRPINPVWPPAKLKILGKMSQQRIPLGQIAGYFNTTIDAIQKAKQRNAKTIGRYNRDTKDRSKDHLLVPYDRIETYDKFEVIKGDAMVIGDPHIPCQDTEMMNRMIKIALRDNIRTLIVGGDLTDQKLTSTYQNVNSEKSSRKFDDELMMLLDIIKVLTKTFDNIYLICGDHDSRVLKRLDYVVNWKSLGKLCNKILNVNGVRSSDYYYCILKSGNQTFRVTHPDRATRRSTTKALNLARKFDQNILQLHGHTYGMEFTENGKYLAVALGCMTEIKHHEYAVIRDVGYPMWRQQFAKIQNGKITIYDKADQLTDWNVELRN